MNGYECENPTVLDWWTDHVAIEAVEVRFPGSDEWHPRRNDLADGAPPPFRAWERWIADGYRFRLVHPDPEPARSRSVDRLTTEEHEALRKARAAATPEPAPEPAPSGDRHADGDCGPGGFGHAPVDCVYQPFTVEKLDRIMRDYRAFGPEELAADPNPIASWMDHNYEALRPLMRSTPAAPVLPPGAPADSVPSPWTEGAVICLARDVPDGWESRGDSESTWYAACLPTGAIGEARPVPVPVEPPTEDVPLAFVKGRRLPDGPLIDRHPYQDASGWWFARGNGWRTKLPVNDDGTVTVLRDQDGDQ